MLFSWLQRRPPGCYTFKTLKNFYLRVFVCNHQKSIKIPPPCAAVAFVVELAVRQAINEHLFCVLLCFSLKQTRALLDKYETGNHSTPDSWQLLAVAGLNEFIDEWQAKMQQVSSGRHRAFLLYV